MASNNLDLIVDVNVTRDTPALSLQDFNQAMFVTDDQVFGDERYRTYTSASELLTDGFDSESATYKAVRTFFSQGGNVNELVVGRRDATGVDIMMDSISDNTAYSIKVQGVTFSYTSGVGATEDEVLDALQVAIDGNATVSAEVTATSSGTGAAATLNIVQDSGFSLSLADVDKSVFDVTYLGQESWADCLTAISENINTWYALLTYDQSVAGILEIAAEVETLTALYFPDNDEAENKGSTDTGTNVRAQLAALNYDRTSFAYSGTASDTFLASGVVAGNIWKDAGASTWDLTPVKGVVADALTRTEINTMDDDGNYFTTYGGIDYYRQGRVSSGEWIDTMRGGDNMASDIQSEVVRAMATANKSGSKIPLTDRGVNQLKAVVSQVCENYVARGFIKDFVTEDDGIGNTTTRRGFTVYSDLVSNLSSNQRASREAPTIVVTADLAGAVHKATVNINLYV